MLREYRINDLIPALTVCLLAMTCQSGVFAQSSDAAAKAARKTILAKTDVSAESSKSPESLGAAPASTSDPVSEIDRHIKEVWDQYGLKPSDPATDGEWCRRLYLDLIGRIPTLAELTEFGKDRSANKREKLVQRLLYDDEYVLDYARNWTTIWTNLLIGRTGGTNRRDLGNREGMQKWLRDSFANEKLYDQFVYELVTAAGTTVPGKEGFNGATNFLANKLGDDAAQATTKTSELFLGIQVQCTQCHNHPFNEWKQNQFWELNAFFRQTRPLRRFDEGSMDVDHVEVVDQDFAGEGASPESAEIYYEQRNGKLKSAYPVFVDGTRLENRSGFLSEANRREELGRLIRNSDYLAAAQVNRMWAHFLGYGFNKPYNDMGPHNPPTHPELLDYISDQFRKSEYDQKKLIQWIVLSRPYGLSSRASKGNLADDPQQGETPKFSRFYLRQMRAEELYESLMVATQAANGNYKKREAEKSRWLRQFSRAFGTDEGGEATTFNGSIPQALMMFNGDLVKSATRTTGSGFLAKTIASDAKPADKIRRLYVAALARRPTKKELKMANSLVAARSSDWKGGRSSGNRNGNKNRKYAKADPTSAALQDIWWAILNSNEFIMNH